MAARSQWNASGCRETNGRYLVWVGAGLLAVVGGSSPSVVEETPLVAPMALARCLVPAAVAALANVLLGLAEASVATTLGVGAVRQQRVASVVIGGGSGNRDLSGSSRWKLATVGTGPRWHPLWRQGPLVKWHCSWPAGLASALAACARTYPAGT